MKNPNTIEPMKYDINNMNLKRVVADVNIHYKIDKGKAPETKFQFVAVCDGEVRVFSSCKEAEKNSDTKNIQKIKVNEKEIKAWYEDYRNRVMQKNNTIESIKRDYLKSKGIPKTKIHKIHQNIEKMVKDALFSEYHRNLKNISFDDCWAEFFDCPPFTEQEKFNKFVQIADMMY